MMFHKSTYQSTDSVAVALPDCHFEGQRVCLLLFCCGDVLRMQHRACIVSKKLFCGVAAGQHCWCGGIGTATCIRQ